MTTKRLGPEETGQAAVLVKQGGLLGVPTETVYGVAANAEDAAAVRRIFDLRNRDHGKPVSILVTGMEMAARYCRNIPPAAYRLAERYWPGPLTMVLTDGGAVPSAVTAGTGALGVRCPDHPLTLALIEKAGVPLAAPSANPAGEEPAKTVQEVLDYFDGQLEAVLDGGPCDLGVASTVLDLTGEEPKVLREGGIPSGELLAFLREEGAMKVIGITGPTGAGKTTALNALVSLGGTVIDADAVYHDLTVSSAPMRAELCARFGDVYDGDALDRKKLGAIVFQDGAALADLNAITHKYVVAETERRIGQARTEGRPAAAVDAIALFESGLDRMCDVLLAIVAPADLRVKRIMAREGISEEYARMRVSAQHDSAWFSERCHITLENTETDTAERFALRARTLFEEILEEKLP